jgi:hypothetical protein
VAGPVGVVSEMLSVCFGGAAGWSFFSAVATGVSDMAAEKYVNGWRHGEIESVGFAAGAFVMRGDAGASFFQNLSLSVHDSVEVYATGRTPRVIAAGLALADLSATIATQSAAPIAINEARRMTKSSLTPLAPPASLPTCFSRRERSRGAACRGLYWSNASAAGSTGSGMFSINLTLVASTIAAGRPSAMRSVSNTSGGWPSVDTRAAN